MGSSHSRCAAILLLLATLAATQGGPDPVQVRSLHLRAAGLGLSFLSLIPHLPPPLPASTGRL